ncbi:LPS export ABC transporter permease LptG [Oryzibacter oryziterrae]|uniref:LPS export ABC transporter permease LptG n=1 Tax=Oryzibacter oryziterrae TaxID=2766474 RepID=UPI001F02ECF0|nr:LPS export ABC transporter permease LptG [Oryzibacter oryziterrae]
MTRMLSLYLARHFAKWILGIFGGLLLLVFLIDAIELIRQHATDKGMSVPLLMAASALRVPVLMGRIVPFTVLLGSLAAFLSLSRSSELVVARAAGVSAWQFILPGATFAFLLGAIMTTAYDPLAVVAKATSERLLAGSQSDTVASLLSERGSSKWMRQKSGTNDVVMHVGTVSNAGATVSTPTFWVFGSDGILIKRIEAESADLVDGQWRLSLATVVGGTGEPETYDSYELPTALTAEQVASGLGSPETVSFWRLPQTISEAKSLALPSERFRLQYQSLLARPLLLAAMVVIAATVSLGLTRAGGTGRMILSGIVAGFVLYVVTEIARGLGNEGLVSPVLAAWAPAIVAFLLGCTALLFREDG